MHEPWRNQSTRGVGVGILLMATILIPTILFIGAGAIEASAQAPEDAIDQSAATRPWWLLWSKTSQQDRVLWAMWTLHIHHVDEGLSSDGLGGVIYRGGYAATFVNSHGLRVYSVGLERKWVSGEWGPLAGMLGYRAGLVYGYDGQLGWMAEKSPILPFVQPVLYGRIGPVSTDLTYTWVVLSLTAGLGF